MFTSAISIAISKATTPAGRGALSTVLDKARALDEIESLSGLYSGQDSSSGQPNQMVSATAAQREALDRERAEAEVEKLEELNALKDSKSVILRLQSALLSDIAFWKMISPSLPASQVALFMKNLTAKEELQTVFASFLALEAKHAFQGAHSE